MEFIWSALQEFLSCFHVSVSLIRLWALRSWEQDLGIFYLPGTVWNEVGTGFVGSLQLSLVMKWGCVKAKYPAKISRISLWDCGRNSSEKHTDTLQKSNLGFAFLHHLVLIKTSYWSYDYGSVVRGTENLNYCMLSCDFRIKCYSKWNLN